MKLHVIGGNAAGSLMHTYRDSNGTWQSFFGNVNPFISAGLPFPTAINVIDSECVQIGSKLYVTILGSGNRVYVAARLNSGTWTEVEDLATSIAAIPNLPSGAEFIRIACTEVKDRLQIVLLTAAGQIIHISNATPSGGLSWIGQVLSTDTFQGKILDITAFSYYPALKKWRLIIGTVTDSGRVVRYRYRCTPDAYSGQIYLDTQHITNPVLRVTNTTLSGLTRITGNISSSDEHYLVCLSNGRVLHNKAGQAQFFDIDPVNGNTGNSYIDVGCVDHNGKLHVVAVRNDGVPFHTYRRSSNDNWQGFMGNINTQAPGAGVLRSIALG